MLPGSLEERLETVARSGIQSIVLYHELWEWTDAQVQTLERQLWSFRLEVAALAALPPWDKHPISLADPGQRRATLDALARAIQRAGQLRASRLIIPPGRRIPGLSIEQQRASLAEAYRACGDLAADHGFIVLLPFFNPREHPESLVETSEQALALLEQARHPALRLLFDIYEEQTASGNVTSALRAARPHLELVQVAGVPDRCEPWRGELYMPSLYRTLAEMNFRGVVALAYRPTGDVVRSLMRAVDEMRAALKPS